MKIAHISDLHFGTLSWSPLQFFSKKWLGNCNLLLRRRGLFVHDRLQVLPKLFQELGVEHVVISGDLSTTGAKREFLQAQAFIQALKLNTSIVPGNHDQYTRASFRRGLFYDYFPFAGDLPGFDLRTDRVAAKRLSAHWWLVALDTAPATPWISSQGVFSLQIEERLRALLGQIPSGDSILLVNHFPFFQHDKARRNLQRGEALQACIRAFPNIALYLHGHTHRHCFANLRGDGLPLILDSGSTPHKHDGRWNLIELGSIPKVTVFGWQEGWKEVVREAVV